MDYHYPICNTANEEIFYKQCAALESHIPGLKKGKALQDVDGSTTQLYMKDNCEILVHNSEYIGAVYIDSDIELKQFFSN